MAPWLFLVGSVISLLAALTALLPGRRMSYASIPYFFFAWLTAELAVHHIAWQVTAASVLIAHGALGSWPGVLGLLIALCAWAALGACQRRASGAGTVLERALRGGLGESYGRAAASDVSTVQVPLRPFKMRHPEVERIRDIPYGDAGPRNYLDVYRGRQGQDRRPVLLQIHGGGWTIGRKDQQGLPLMYHMASRGWVCVAPNYRLSPRATFPEHIIDVKRALAWVRRHAADYGADPSLVIVTGGSAGGHLAALLALTAKDRAFQPGFEDVDTSVAACVPLYGVYDLLDRNGFWGKRSLVPFLERVVMKCSPVKERACWEQASPLDRIHPAAPPFFVIHGTHDSLVPVEEARHFVRRLRAVSRNPVVYAELPGAQHAFDLFHSVRCRHAVLAVARFCEHIRERSAAVA